MTTEQIQTLVENAKAGCQKSYTALFNHFYDQLFGFFIAAKAIRDSDTAQELTQITLTKALCKIHQYKPDNPFGAWVMRIAKNELVNYVRSNRSAKNTSDLTDFSSYTSRQIELSIPAKLAPIDPLRQLETNEKYGILHRAVNSLESEFSNPIRLFYFQGKSYDEISDILQINLGTIKTRIHHAKKKLKAALQML